LGSTLGGYVRDANDPYHVIGAGSFIAKNQKILLQGREIPLLSEITLNSNLSDEVNFATLTHELGHIYCGHIGSGGQGLWPNRANLTKNVREFEAESVSFLVCKRMGIDTPAAQYLSGYLNSNTEIPEVSLDVIFKAVQSIESMTKKRLKSRLKDEQIF
jgi:antirestriction protein ArdC